MTAIQGAAGQRQVRGEVYGSGDRIYTLRVNETMEEPPLVGDGRAAVFLERTRSGSRFDHRAKRGWWKGELQLIGRLGDPAEWG
jgi:hypothetical protein